MPQGLQCLPTGDVVHRAAVVRVDQAVVPQFGALVDVGYAGHGQREQLLTQRIVLGVRLKPGHQTGQLAGHRPVEHRVQPAVHRTLEVGVRVVPRRVPGRFPHRLLGVRVQPVAQFAGDLAAGRPDTKDVLPQKQSGRRVGGWGHRLPAGDEFGPQRRYLGQDADAGPDILAAFGVVGGQRRHGLRPQSGAGGGAVMEFRGADAEPVWFAADFVQRYQPGVAVEQAILDRLGRHGAAQLLQSAGGLAAAG